MLCQSFAVEAGKSKAHAMWIYKTDVIIANADERAALFAFCKARQIVDLFWQTHYRPALAAVKGGAVTIPNADALRDFLCDANGQGLRIHALSGDPSYTIPKMHPRALARVDATLAFNRASQADERFAGVHFDIEPHGLKSWKTATAAERCLLLTQLVEVSAKAAQRLHENAPEMLFGADVTWWFDKANAAGTAAYPVTFRGVTKDATKHLLDLAENIGIMSYRNTTTGRNGITALVSRTITYADTAHGRAFIGVKMADIGPPSEGFYGSTEEAMMKALQPLKETYADHRGYAGIAYFMYEAFKEMPRSLNLMAKPGIGR